MNDRVDVTLQVEPEIASALADPARRAAAGRMLADLLNGNHLRDLLAEAMAAAQGEAQGNGLTPDMIDAEIQTWRSEKPV